MLRIIDWDENFENAKSREIKNLTWVPFPNKQDGDGYTDLMEHKDGPAHFGAWCAIAQVASKCRPRGTLVRDGGEPHNPTTLARITRIPKQVLASAIKRLLFEIKWLEYVSEDGTRKDLTDYSHEGAVLSHQSAVAPHQSTLNGREGTEEKRKKEEKAPPVDFFENFWQAFPPKRRTKKGKARVAWERAVKKAAPETIIAAAVEYAASPTGTGKYVQGPEPWLNGECWEDDREAWQDGDARPASRVATAEDGKNWNPVDAGLGEKFNG